MCISLSSVNMCFVVLSAQRVPMSCVCGVLIQEYNSSTACSITPSWARPKEGGRWEPSSEAVT